MKENISNKVGKESLLKIIMTVLKIITIEELILIRITIIMMAIITIVIKKIEKSEHGKNSNQSKPLYMHYKARKKIGNLSKKTISTKLY